jgi:hypothetical protein
MSERDLEEPTPDAQEQRRAVADNGDEPPADLPLDVDEADAAEQRREVKLDEDDYR